MKLMMFLSNELIDTIPLCHESITLPGYLGKMKRQLQLKYASLIECLNVEPVFLVSKAPQNDAHQTETNERTRGNKK